jgi:hypothetical protein
VIARFDVDGVAWLVFQLLRFIVALVRLGASAVGTIVIILVACGLLYAVVAAVRRHFSGEPAGGGVPGLGDDSRSAITSDE